METIDLIKKYLPKENPKFIYGVFEENYIEDYYKTYFHKKNGNKA